MACIPQNSTTEIRKKGRDFLREGFGASPRHRGHGPCSGVGHPGSGMPRSLARVKLLLFLLTVRSLQIILGSRHRNIDGKHLAEDAELPQLPRPQQHSLGVLPPELSPPSLLLSNPKLPLLVHLLALSFPTRERRQLRISAPPEFWEQGMLHHVLVSLLKAPRGASPAHFHSRHPILMESRYQIPELLRLGGTLRIIQSHPLPWDTLPYPRVLECRIWIKPLSIYGKMSPVCHCL